MLGVAILSLLLLSLFGLLRTHVDTIAALEESTRREREILGFQNLVEGWVESWQAPARVDFTAVPHKFDEFSSDEFSFLSRPGVGLLSADGVEDYRVTLMMRRGEDQKWELGIRRVRNGDVIEVSKDWVPLLRGVKGLEMRFWDPQQHSWIDQWAGRGDLPRLMRFRLWLVDREKSVDFTVGVPPRGQPL